jgi:hypothetical protein
MRSNAKSDLDCRIDRARLAGAMHSYTPAEFKNCLLEIGFNGIHRVTPVGRCLKDRSPKGTRNGKIRQEDFI